MQATHKNVNLHFVRMADLEKEIQMLKEKISELESKLEKIQNSVENIEQDIYVDFDEEAECSGHCMSCSGCETEEID